MTYQPSKSHSKALRASVPPGAVLVAVWVAREFLGRDIPSDVALAALTGIVYGVEWARNRIKHGWKR